MLIFLIPKCNKVSKITTAFYSTQESIKCKGKSFTPTPKTSVKAKATFTALKASLHYPTSINLGILLSPGR